MMLHSRRFALLLAIAALPAFPQAKSIIGTVKSLKAETAELDIQPDKGDLATVKMSAETVFQRIAPGETNLKNATPISAADISVGDRVLISLMPEGAMARRIVVMSSNEIAKKNEADKQDWIKRGVSGVVATKAGNTVTVKIRGIAGETTSTVTVSDTTRYRRYSPDSVKFADAKVSSLKEVSVGDQLRARGQKSEDGSKVTADEVVFGTFITKGGTITAIDPAAKTITIADLSNKKPLVIHLTADSSLKSMPNFGGTMGGGPGGASGGAPRANGGQAGPGGPGGAGGPGGRGGDLSQLLERMPATKLEDLKTGSTIVVSSTKGAKDGDITAIMIVANADMLIRMAQMQQTRIAGRPDAGPSLSGLGMGGMSGLDLPGMIP
ncbi:MAG: hypothetical protein HY820_42090 [Acidobacteria bacterium]|nr:hypothetical protein [Acidobacteriota bacterium]